MKTKKLELNNKKVDKVKNKKRIVKKILITTLILICCAVLISGITIGGYLIKLNSSLNFDESLLKQVNSELHIFDYENNQLSSISSSGEKVRINELPSYVPESFISIEDKNFYSHNGLNYKRIIKAIYNNLRSNNLSEGASTISQQLIKNTHLSNEKTLDRKVKEMLLTLKMEKKLDKNTILEKYLNAIYFGNGAYGLDSASRCYFNKSAKDLSISESATLAGIIKSPKTYSPLYNMEKCTKRRNLVLNEMLKDKIITNEQFENAINETINISNRTKITKNFYQQAVIDEATQILDISEKDLAVNDYYIFTYYDKDLQNSLISSIKNDENYHKNSYGNTVDSCGIIIDNKTGEIKAFSGKSDYDLVNMYRSPGSSIKPILVYAPAIENGIISPISPILDEQTSFSGYTPHNVSNKYYGYISATQSVEKSLNIPAIKIMEQTGLNRSINMAKQCGIEFEKTDNSYALALGGMTKGTTVKELVNSYIPFSNHGKFINAKFISKICDKNGNNIYENKVNEKYVMSEETAYLMMEMLISGVKKGTSSRLNSLDYQVAGKTGTVCIKNTNLNSDVWSVCYTTDYTAGIWLGNSTGSKENMLEGSNNGGTYCTSMLKQTFDGIYTKKSKPNNFEIPQGIESVKLDSLELENNHKLALADENTPEMFITKANFNKKYSPKLMASSFSELKAIELNIKLENNEPILSFNSLPQVEYKIYRINDDEYKLIDTIKNKKGLIEIVDKETENNEFYTYYIEAVATNNATKNQSKRIRSNSVKIYTSNSKQTDNISNIISKKKKGLFSWFE